MHPNVLPIRANEHRIKPKQGDKPQTPLYPNFTYLESVYDPVRDHKELFEIYLRLTSFGAELTKKIRAIDRLMKGKKGNRRLTITETYWKLKLTHPKLANWLIEFTDENKTVQYEGRAPFKINRKGESTKTLEALKVSLKSALPSVIFSGIIAKGQKKTKKTVIGHSSFFIIDLDHVASVSETRKVLERLPEIALVFTSPSGDGVKALVRTNYDFSHVSDWANDYEHKAACEVVLEYVNNALSAQGIACDTSGVNVNRHCFLPYDPDAYLNLNAQPLSIDKAKVSKVVEKEVKEAEKRNTSAEGVVLYSGEIALDKARKLADERYGEYGNDSRHDYVFKYFGNYCNRFGVELEIARDYGAEYFGDLYDRDGLRALDLAYENTANFGVWGIETKAKYKDPFEYKVESKKLSFTGYISDNESIVKELERFIFENRKVQVKAPTGSGKTYFVFTQLVGLMATVDSPLIFAVPTQALAEQISKEFNAPCIMQGSDKNDLRACEFSKIIVCTYDSLHKLSGFVPTCSAVIFDESHHLVSDCSHGFKFEAYNQCWEIAMQAPRTVLISATPCEYMDGLGFKFIELSQTNTPPFKVYPVLCEGKPVDALLNGLKALNEPDKIQIIFLDSTKKLNAIRRNIKKLKLATDKEISVLSSDTKKANTVYESICDTGLIPEGIRYVLTTRLIADGVNIKNENVSGIHLVDVKNEELFLQFPARFRKLKEHKIYSYRTDKTADWSSTPTVEKALSVRYNSAKAKRDELELYPNSVTHTQLCTTYRSNGVNDPNHHIFMTASGAQVVSDLHIFNSQLLARDNCTGAFQFYARIDAKYDHVQICEAITFKVATSDTITAALKADKKEEKKAIDQMYRKLEHSPEVALAAVYQDTKSDLTKATIEQVLEPEKYEEKVQLFKAQNPELVEFKTHNPVKQYCKLFRFGLTPSAINEALRIKENRTNQGFARLESRLHAQSLLCMTELELSSRDEGRRTELKQVRSALAKYNTDLGKGEGSKVEDSKRLSAEILRAFVSEILGYDVKNKATKIARELFVIHEGRDGKTKRRFYYLERELTLSDVLSDYGMTQQEYEDRARLQFSNSLKISEVSILNSNTLDNSGLTPKPDNKTAEPELVNQAPF